MLPTTTRKFAISDAIAIISKTKAGDGFLSMFDSDEIPLGQNISARISNIIVALEKFGAYHSPEEFFHIFSHAIERVDKYEPTPETLHLYLNDLQLPSGDGLNEGQLEFLYLRLLDWICHYGVTGGNGIGPNLSMQSWMEELTACLPCPCDDTSPVCECKSVSTDYWADEAGAEAAGDDEACDCHRYAYRNLYRLIYPIVEGGDFSYLKRRLELLESDQERLKLIIAEKVAFEQEFGATTPTTDDVTGLVDMGFSDKCRLEIEKLENFIRLAGQEDKTSEPDADNNKFTTKQAMALLDALSPEFRGADNTTKAAFIVKLTPYNGAKNIAQDFTYLRRDNYTDLVNHWKERFIKTGRGRKKTTQI